MMMIDNDVQSRSNSPRKPQVIGSCREMHAQVMAARASGRRVGLVPTMGALHEGHLSLVRESAAQCDVTVVTIFVNPTQFGPGEDLDKYPRTLDDDLLALSAHNVSLVFAPSVEEMYPPGSSTFVEPSAVAAPLEGRCRPGHFRGVATIVLKLFLAAPADIAYFGAKDYQQSLVIRRMVEDLNIPIEIRVCPTVREADGLAMSSRNRYLSREDRRKALALSQSLDLADRLAGQGERDARVILRRMREVFEKAEVDRIDYIALADPDTLEEIEEVRGPVVAAVAAHVGGARLIDNRRIG